MTDQEVNLLMKRSRSFALLCAVILILVTGTFLVSYFSLPYEQTPETNSRQEVWLCGNALTSNSQGSKLFKQNCAVCHTVTDQKLTGPGLAGIADRLPKPAEEWFTAWVLNSEKVLRSRDAYAKKIYKEYNKTAMTVFEGQLSRDDIHEIYIYLSKEASGPVP